MTTITESKKFHLQLAKAVYILRSGRNMTQRELAHKSKLFSGYISEIECGRKNKKPTMETLIKLSEGLDTDLEGLMCMVFAVRI